MSKFEISGSGTNYRFNLYAPNGKIIGRGTQGYSSLQACKTGIESVKNNSSASVIDTTIGESSTGSRFEIYESVSEYRFRLLAKNGENILASEGYVNKSGCKNGIESVQKNAPNAKIVE
ncbi:MAG: YegP family protein [Tissierellales bacterium]|nr:YegP family protein [Tissierellales bacterium]